jgi:hypothetical protein
MMFGRLPRRPVPMGRRHAGPGASDRSYRSSASPLGYRPLYLVFRRSAATAAPPSMRSADGPPIELSVHFAVTLRWAERLTSVVQQAVSLPMPRILARGPVALSSRAVPTVLDPPGSPTSRSAGGRPGSLGAGPVRAPSVGLIRPMGRSDRGAVQVVVDGPRLGPVGLLRTREHRPGTTPVPGRRQTAEPSAPSRRGQPVHGRAWVIGHSLTHRFGPADLPLGWPTVFPGIDAPHVISSGPGRRAARSLRGRSGDRFASAGAWRSELQPDGSGAGRRTPQLLVGDRTGRSEASTGRRGAGSQPQRGRPPGAAGSLVLADVHSTWPGSPASTSQIEVPERARRRVTRVHRLAPETATGAVPTPTARGGPSGGPPAPAHQPFDLDRLDRDLWKRFEKRIRVEQERRGRR